MKNQAMLSKLKRFKVIDVSGYPRTLDGHYILPQFISDIDYADCVTEQWIWSIGRRKSDGVLLASKHSDLYQNKDFECLWLR